MKMNEKSSNHMNEIIDETDDNDLYTQKRPTLSFVGILISTFFLRVAFGSTTVLMPIYIFLHLQMEGWEAKIESFAGKL